MLKSPLLRTFPLALLLAAAGCSSAPTEGPAASTQDDLAVAPPTKALRIAVVGAGPSGLTAASTLKDLGYKNVTVFERNARVGGKVYSLHLGDAVSEMGAVFASPDYTTVLGLADKYGVPYVAYGSAQTILDEHGQRQTAQSFLTSRYSTLEILAATAAYAGVLTLFAPVNEDGLATVPPESDLYLPFNQFAAKYGITPIAELVRSIMVGFGYGYYETAPAIYYMKLIGWLVKVGGPQGLQQATYYTFPTGYQSIWDHVAGDLDVRLSSEVTSIVRNAPGKAPVQITVNGRDHYDFDEVIISAPLNKVSSFMSLTPSESALFSQVQTERYDVSLFAASGLQTNEALFFYGNAFPTQINHVDVWANRAAGAPFVAYQIAQTGPGVDLASVLGQDVASQGGTFLGLVSGPDGKPIVQDWVDYFPRVSTDALRSGFAYKVEALQGDNHTFYVGGSLSFETVEHSARYARTMVKAHFLPAFF